MTIGLDPVFDDDLSCHCYCTVKLIRQSFNWLMTEPEYSRLPLMISTALWKIAIRMEVPKLQLVQNFITEMFEFIQHHSNSNIIQLTATNLKKIFVHRITYNPDREPYITCIELFNYTIFYTRF